jgi:threonine synthase
MGSRLQCPRCSSTFPLESFRSTCTCGSLLDVRHDPPPVPAQKLAEIFGARLRPPSAANDPFPGVWRFRELILPEAPDPALSLREGNTPLFRHPAISHFAGIEELWLKHEGMNPTGSFKDRGMTVAVGVARRLGYRALLCASTGNTAASLAAYGALGGLPVLVLAPQGKVALGKMIQTLAFGAFIVEITGDFDEALRLAMRLADDHRIALLNSVNPFRIEGQKTAAFEIAEGFGWDVPDWVVLPAGNLGNISAYGKAFEELQSWGFTKRMPRLAAIQAEGANPFYRSFQLGFAQRVEVKAETIATAIRIGSPASFERAVRAVRSSEGVVEQVTDVEILEAKGAIDACGLGCEPASAAALAGVRKLRSRGIIGPKQRVVAVLTGNLLKDPDAVLRRAQDLDNRTTLPASEVDLRKLVERVLQRER